MEPAAPEDGPCWRLAHALGLCAGAAAFLLGSGLLFESIQTKKHLLETEGSASLDSGDGSAAAAELAMLGLQSAWLYIVGSLSFCFVDVQELVTFTDFHRRVGIGASLLGSLAYVVGAAGHLDAVFAVTRLIGTLGFLIGATISGCAHAWKMCTLECHPLCSYPRPYAHITLCRCSGLLTSVKKPAPSSAAENSELDDIRAGFCTAACVELGRLFGAVRPESSLDCDDEMQDKVWAFCVVGVCARWQRYDVAWTNCRGC